MAERPSLSDRCKSAALKWADKRRARPGVTLVRTLDYVAALLGLGMLAIVAMSIALGSAAIGLELGARLAFMMCLILALRPWVAKSS